MRSSGILMHISSLPSPYGIGTMGKEARKFVDFFSGRMGKLRNLRAITFMMILASRLRLSSQKQKKQNCLLREVLKLRQF